MSGNLQLATNAIQHGADVNTREPENNFYPLFYGLKNSKA
jgi:hypothetical protein